jgi:hypothetical protein
MIFTIFQIILIVILSGFVIYLLGRILAKGFFDEIEKKLMQKFKEHKSKEDERKEK